MKSLIIKVLVFGCVCVFLPNIGVGAKSNLTKPSKLQGYFHPDESILAIKNLAKEHPGYAKVHKISTLVGLDIQTALGDSLYALQVTKGAGTIKDRPKILIIGQHHGREVMTPHMVIDNASDLLARSKNTTNRNWLAHHSVWFVPVANPDGSKYVFEKDTMWRKNLSKNGKQERVGVDLNRNYDFQWGKCGLNSDKPASPIYRGPKAFSEPESRLLDALNGLLKAQFLVSYHSPGNEILFPYHCGKLGDKKIYLSLKDKLVNSLGYGQRKASSSGEDFEHHFARHGSLGFLVEAGFEMQPSFKTYNDIVKPSILKILPLLEEEMAKPFLEVKVIDQNTKKPLAGVDIQIEEAPLFEGEKRHTDIFGKMRRRLEFSPLNLKLTTPAGRVVFVRFNYSSESRFLALTI